MFNEAIRHLNQQITCLSRRDWRKCTERCLMKEVTMRAFQLLSFKVLLVIAIFNKK